MKRTNNWKKHYAYNKMDKQLLDEQITNCKKRKLSEKTNKSKRVKVDEMLGWVSATKTKNYLLGDQCVDWLSLYHKSTKNNNNLSNHINFLFEGGHIFEKKVYDELYDIYKEDFVLVLSEKDVKKFVIEHRIDDFIRKKHQEVKTLMNDGIPFIAQAPLINETNKTYGIADILIRSDYLEVLFDTFILDDEIYVKAPLLKMKDKQKYHYRIIDCKWTTMTLCVDGKTIRNEGFFPAYKGQLAVYTAALEILQGYIPNYAYIMAKSWKIGKTNIEKGDETLYSGSSAFDRAGVIDYKDRDVNFLTETKKAIKWYQRVATEGDLWQYGDDKPSVIEMYPNVNKSFNPMFDKIKYELALKYGDPTLVWYVNSYNRNIGQKNNIYDIRDPDCTIEKLGIERTSRGLIIEKIININKYNETQIISPNKIKNNMNNWQKQTNLDYYIDFETINYNLYCKVAEMDLDHSFIDSDVTYMIGIGFDKNNNLDKIIEELNIDYTKCNYHINNSDKWTYVCFYLMDFVIENELELFRLFYEFINLRRATQKNKSRLFHWTPAEERFMNKSITRIPNIKNVKYRQQYMKTLNIFNSNGIWIDMHQVFEKEPIVIKGSYRYKLKHIGNAFYNNGLIKTSWNDITDGFSSMVEAIKLYRKGSTINFKIYKKIIDYNEVDCKVIWDIVGYLRKNHC